MLNLHLVSFAIPYPANYGGAIDVFFKLKALKKLGVNVILHVFEYDRERAEELNEYCKEVYYYPRVKRKKTLLNHIPFIVATRNDKKLLENLKKDNFPILFDGLHTTFYANHPELKNRAKYLRSHNIEHDYYNGLADVELNLIKKGFFKFEAKKLLEYEKQVIREFDAIFAISEKDKTYFEDKHKKVEVISAFHTNEEIDLPEGNGSFYFYHGSLDVGENHEAAMYLIHEVFADREEQLVIAGKLPSQELVDACNKFTNVTLKLNISHAEILQLMKEAKVNILPTFQATGIKLKLLLALYQGRYALVNNPMIENTGLESLCLVANSPEAFHKEMNELKTKTWNKTIELEKRIAILNNGFGNLENAKKMLRFIEGNTLVEDRSD